MRIRTHRERDRGQVALEYIGFVAILLFVGLAAIQLGVAAYAVNQAGTGARAAARAASLDDPRAGEPKPDPVAAGTAAVSGWLDPRVMRAGGGGDGVTYTVTVKIPSVVPGIPDFGTATRTSTMPKLRPHN
ncbi:pilus assembly protein [Streptomyces violascens]|uniref:Septum formation initiator n=1 Tax=Streptomyces violascens TaxID=67381 RepID=A0ABQ3QLK9_9ACTN|nr:pilus assembly protein [Streptomyces violascens]GGU36252.1 septum formation initiator [Streptomyces violascens]GHI38162.1 septum formation initiator [Streptomyces violascens]